MSKLKNSEKGKRCFIIGTGRSIKKQDLTLLKDEIVIGVGGLFMHQDITIFNPKYYVLSPVFEYHKQYSDENSYVNWLSAMEQTLYKDTIYFLSDLDKPYLEIMKQNYKKSDYFKEVFQHIEELYNKNFDKLSDFNLASIEMLNKLFDIKIDIVFSSNLKSTTTKNERLVELLKQVNATHYLSGIGAKDYHSDKPFEKENIEVIWQDFKHPVYPQLHGEFIPYLSSIDLLFNCGIKKSREILRSI